MYVFNEVLSYVFWVCFSLWILLDSLDTVRADKRGPILCWYALVIIVSAFTLAVLETLELMHLLGCTGRDALGIGAISFAILVWSVVIRDAPKGTCFSE